MTLPSFIKKDPIMSAPATGISSSPAPSPIEAANQLGASVARLLSERDSLIADLDFQRKNVETLTARLEVAERDAEHYRAKAAFFERFSMTITANFSVIRSIIDETQRKANELAKTPSEAPPEDKSIPTVNPLTSLEQAIMRPSS